MPGTPEKARIGVIGTGWWATAAHLPALEENRDATIVAIADPDTANRAAAAERFRIPHAFATAEELLSEVEVDGVVIAAPHAFHYPLARLALEQGKHVLLEKPMVIVPAHGRALIDLARKQRVELVVGYPWHYNRQVIELRELIASGAIGGIEFVSTLFASIVRELYRGNPEAYRTVFDYPVNVPKPSSTRVDLAGGGQGQWQVTHSGALMLWLTGLAVERVAALTASFELDVDLVDAVSLAFVNGAVGSLASTGSVAPGNEEILEYRIFGSRGHILFDVNQGSAEVHDARGSIERLSKLPSSARYPQSAPVDNLVDIVLERGANGSPPEVGLAAVELVDAIYRSARRARAIAVRDEAAQAQNRIGHVWRVKPGKADEYARRHATIWPDLENLLQAGGVHAYTIYLWGDLVFSHMDVSDYERLVEIFNASPVAQRWEAEMADLLEYPNADPVTGWPERIGEVWSL